MFNVHPYTTLNNGQTGRKDSIYSLCLYVWIFFCCRRSRISNAGEILKRRDDFEKNEDLSTRYRFFPCTHSVYRNCEHLKYSVQVCFNGISPKNHFLIADPHGFTFSDVNACKGTVSSSWTLKSANTRSQHAHPYQSQDGHIFIVQ